MEDRFTREYFTGKFDAQKDICEGRFILKSLGRRSDWVLLYEKILKQEYGIHSDMVAGCRVRQEESDYVRGYNEIVEQAIKERYGNDFFDLLWARISQEMEKREKKQK